MAASLQNLGHCQGESFTNPVLINVVDSVFETRAA